MFFSPKIKKKDNRRVVITGLGVVSSIGIGWEEFWKSLLAGKSGITKISAFSTDQFDHHYAGEVQNFKPGDFIHKKKLGQMGRSSQMAIAATKLALEDAMLDSKYFEKAGICLGTTLGESRIIEQIKQNYGI